MTGPGVRALPPRGLAFGVGACALAVWAVLALFGVSAALRGWLIGFVFTASLGVGSLAAMLILRLVGGRWGEAFGPELEPAARATPVLLPFMLPVLIGLPAIYPWAADPSHLEPQVRAGYLNAPFFILRTVVAVGGWSAAALLLPRIMGPAGRLRAGLALAFHGVAVSVVGVDWILSVEPGWTSSNFGMDLAAQQLACAFAYAALQGRRKAPDAASGDVAGLMFATLIGLIYLEFMSYLVVWYGDRPSLDTWYILRSRGPWRALPLASLAFGIAAIVLLAIRRAFGTHRAAALVGGCLLAGVLVYQVWLLAPDLGGACLVPAVFALVGQVGVWIGLAGGLPRLRRGSGALAHAA